MTLWRTALAALLIGAVGAPLAAQGTRVPAGTGTLYVGGFPNRIFVVDEATEKVTREIRLKSGIPRQLKLSHDRRRFYLLDSTMEQIEVVDVASASTVGTFDLSEGPRRVRIRSYEIDPQERFLILLTKTATKRIDRWEIGPPTLLQYDLASRQVTRTIPWPGGEERESANLVFSPDGKLLYFFGDEEILVFETGQFAQVDRWDLARLEEGLGRLDFGAVDRFNEEPGFFTGLFTVEDPVQRRRLMGLGRVNLAEKQLEFRTLGPAQPVSFALAPGRKLGYGLLQQIGRYEFWCFDVERGEVRERREFAGRPRMALKVSSNGRVLYIYQAGNTIDLYDAATYRYLRTIVLDGDMTTDLYVLPATPPRR